MNSGANRTIIDLVKIHTLGLIITHYRVNGHAS